MHNVEIKKAAEWATGQLSGISHGSVTLKFVMHDSRLKYVDKSLEIKSKVEGTEPRYSRENTK